MRAAWADNRSDFRASSREGRSLRHRLSPTTVGVQAVVVRETTVAMVAVPASSVVRTLERQTADRPRFPARKRKGLADCIFQAKCRQPDTTVAISIDAGQHIVRDQGTGGLGMSMRTC